MSYRDDYLKKQIDELGQVLARLVSDLLQLKNDGKTGQGIEATNQLLKKEIDLDVSEMLAIPSETFIRTLQKKEFRSVGFEKLADVLLFLADNGMDKQTDTIEKKALYERALIILEYLQETQPIYSIDRHVKIDRIKKYI